MVNKNRAKKFDKEEPSLTIYPFSIDELKEQKIVPKAISENESKAIKIQTDQNVGKNTKNEKLRQTPTQTQPETEQIVKYNGNIYVNVSVNYVLFIS